MAKDGRRIRIFSALEVANICGVVNQTAINWIRNGHLKAFTTPGGQYRIYAKDLAAFLNKRGMDDSGEALHGIIAKAAWNTILIALEQPVNDLARTETEHLLPEYKIIWVFDWFETGRRITEAKPGFILLDAGLPGVDITKVIRTVKEDPSLGKPCIFLLTDGSSLFHEKEAGGEKIIEPQNYADAALEKPLNLDKLKTTLKNFERYLNVDAIA